MVKKVKKLQKIIDPTAWVVIPCAAHRLPHQKGKTKSASKCKSVANALIKASRNEVPVAAKGLG